MNHANFEMCSSFANHRTKLHFRLRHLFIISRLCDVLLPVFRLACIVNVRIEYILNIVIVFIVP